MPARTAAQPAPPPAQQAFAPRWFRVFLVVLAAVYLMSRFSGAAGDSDTWWHLAAGKYIWQNHRLPVPDPFSYTTYMGTPAYPGELNTRHFNLTHEWGMELIYYVAYAAGGFPAMILLRAFLLTFFCGMTGWLTWRRSHSFYRGLAASLIAAVLSQLFAADRAYLATFVMVTLTVAAYETRRGLWLLPPAFLVWANCHGGFIMGWAIAGAYSAEAVILRLRGKPLADERKIWIVSALAVALTAINPNGLGVIEVMRYYRSSPLQSNIFEWNYPAWWPPDPYNTLAVATALVLLWARRRVRVVDWLLFAALGGASAMALRNTFLMGFIGPIFIAAYIPAWKRRVPAVLEYAAAALLLLAMGFQLARGNSFQLHMADEKYPVEAVDFLTSHHVTGRLFNTYELGGYLMWRLWPQASVFLDGRALNESVWQDYLHMAYNADFEGKTTMELLRKYDAQIIVMTGFNYRGQLLFLAAALADPSQKEWKLVYQDAKAVVYMRNPPPGVQALNSLEALTSIESQCRFFIDHGWGPGCARAVGDMYMRIGELNRAREWVAAYLRMNPADPVALGMYRRLTQGR